MSLVMVCISLQAALKEEEIPLLGERKIKSYNVVHFKREARAPKKAVVLARFDSCLDSAIFFHKDGAPECTTSFDHECLRGFHDPERKVTVCFWRKDLTSYKYHNFHGDDVHGRLSEGVIVPNSLKKQGFSYTLSLYDVVRMAFLRSVKINGESVPFFYSSELHVCLQVCYEYLKLGDQYKASFPKEMLAFSEDITPGFLFPEGYTRRWSVSDSEDPLKIGMVSIKMGKVFLRGELVPEEKGCDLDVDRGEVFFAMLAALQEARDAKRKYSSEKKIFWKKRKVVLA